MADNFSSLILILRMKINLNNSTEFYFLIGFLFSFFIFLFCFFPNDFIFLSFLAIPFFLIFSFHSNELLTSFRVSIYQIVSKHLDSFGWHFCIHIFLCFLLISLSLKPFRMDFFVKMSSEIYLFSYFSKLYSCLTSPRDQSQYFDSVCSTVSL